MSKIVHSVNIRTVESIKTSNDEMERFIGVQYLTPKIQDVLKSANTRWEDGITFYDEY